MSTKIIKADIEKLVENERELSYEHFPAFNSPHEGYAVIKEEIEEAKDELDQIDASFDYLWESIKLNMSDPQSEYIDSVQEYAVGLACEAIQVAAMCQKYRESLLVKQFEEEGV